MKTFEKLRLKLNKKLGLNIPDDAVFSRVHAGREDVSAGAWSWSCYTKDYLMNIGSAFTATDILKAKKITILRSVGYLPEIWIDDGWVK